MKLSLPTLLSSTFQSINCTGKHLSLLIVKFISPQNKHTITDFWRVGLEAMNTGFSASRKLNQNSLLRPTKAVLGKHQAQRAWEPTVLRISSSIFKRPALYQFGKSYGLDPLVTSRELIG